MSLKRRGATQLAQNPPETRASTCGWRRALVVLVPALLLAGGLLLAGCSDLTRYRVLSFFFDEVPPPAGIPPEAVRTPPPGAVPWQTEAAAERQEQVAQAAEAPPAPPEPAKPVFFHAPYQRRQCAECHAAEASYQTPIREADVCGKCHADHLEWRQDDWVHGPAALGRCTICPDPHKAEHDNLLTAAQPDLCWTCHDSARVMAQSYHRQGDVTDCSFCHDPHSAGNRMLLADSETYARSRPALLPAPPGHAAWDKATCATCHQAAQSNVVVKDVDQKCLGCHDRAALAPPGQTPHAAVSLGRCTLCHTPHRSPRPHLIRPQAEKVCYTCHDPAEVRTPAHPQVVRADCLICHRGHYSELPHLLKPGIPPAQ
jgi:predicted CXXCH cytochrome family protein